MTILPTHTCFDDALDYMAARLKEDPRAEERLLLVHAICLIPEGKQKGERFAHAWVEENGLAYQDGFLSTGERVTYAMTVAELRGNLSPQKELRYTARQAWRENRRTMTYGPWAPEIYALCGGGEVFWPKCEAS